MSIKIALAGNPNSGKTTLFNALTGGNQSVGNWPGVTVEKKEGTLKNNKDVSVIDLPGIYSLSPYSLEEVIARNFLLDEAPDVIVNVIDGTNLERNLFLTTQLLETGIPVVAALNMADEVEHAGDKIDADKLSAALGASAIAVSALKNTGLSELIDAAMDLAEGRAEPSAPFSFSAPIEKAIESAKSLLSSQQKDKQRFFAIKLLEKDEKIAEKLGLKADIASVIIEEAEKKAGSDLETILTEERYDKISAIAAACYQKKRAGVASLSDKIDRVVTNRVLALPIFAAVIFLIYFISVTTVGAWVTDWTNDGLFGESWSFFGLEAPGIPVLLGGALEAAGASDWLYALVIDGIVAGVGAVIGFVPQMFVLFFFLSALEFSGYMARIAFILDRIFRRFGLSGKSFIPMLVGTGCGVPGVMASRTIENGADRRLTIMTTTFMPCSAKLPLIAMIAGAVFGGKWWVAPTMYFIGIGSVVITGLILKKTRLFAGETSPFVMELPPYRAPGIVNVLRAMWERGFSFIQRAGSVILLSAVAIWFLSSFGFTEDGFRMVDDLDDGLLAHICSVIAVIFAPLGFGSWQAAVATITGLIAKENIVGTMGVLYGFAEVGEAGEEIWSSLASNFSTLSGFTFLLFNLYCPPCFAAIGAIKREMNNVLWTLFAVGYQLCWAYAVSLIVYQLGSFFGGGAFSAGTAAAVVVLAALVWLLVRKPAGQH